MRIDEDASFGCAFCKERDGIVVFQSAHIYPEVDCDVSGFDPTTRTKPVLVGGGVIRIPHPKPNWIGRYSNPLIQAERNEANAIPNSAICKRCLAENKTLAKLIELKDIVVATELTRY